MIGLNEQEGRVLAFVRRHQAERGYSPSLREIGAGVGCRSASQLDISLYSLEEHGFLRRRHNRARAIELLASAVDIGRVRYIPLGVSA
ncbi:MAG: hypothetical protein EON59_06860 [Alphaproteobacteria bacterium]|nr:MAG: hypothetical protein EON59_06860 [Alphaproteobacteria bacterium]